MTVFVFDNTILSHFARADRLAVLESITSDDQCAVPSDVFDEIQRGAVTHPEIADLERRLFWMERAELDGVDELVTFARLNRELGDDPQRNIGECAALAWARTRNAVAIIDDKPARAIAEAEGIECHGSLWLLLRAYRATVIDRPTLESVIDDLIATGMRLPLPSGSSIVAWGYHEGYLP